MDGKVGYFLTVMKNEGMGVDSGSPLDFRRKRATERENPTATSYRRVPMTGTDDPVWSPST